MAIILKNNVVQCHTFFSELGLRVVCLSLSNALRLSWTTASSDEDLRIQTQILKRRNFSHYFKITQRYGMDLLTTGGSLPSLLPSDALLSEPQEVGEHSLFWAVMKNGMRRGLCFNVTGYNELKYV